MENCQEKVAKNSHILQLFYDTFKKNEPFKGWNNRTDSSLQFV